jgi:5-methylcytosine-specific restriction endonuclease McrA
MRKLTPKNYDETNFNTAINGKSRIIGDVKNIQKRLADYESNKNKLENLTQKYTKPSDCKGLKDIACDLYKLYDSKSTANIKFKKEVQKISEGKCPYCGINEASHLDHFLPRAKFPEFSIFAPNLIHVCSICNSTYKSDDVITPTGERKFFNPYFDDFIETTQFLKCEIELNGSVYPIFKFYIEDLSATMPYEYSVMKNHFEAMHLQTRYMEQVAKEKFRIFRNGYIDLKQRTYYETSLEEIKNDIDKRLRGYQCENINNLKKVFWESLKDSDECLMLIVDKKIV